MQENFKILGHRMKSLRMEKGISQTKMAEMVCLSQTHLSNIESGKASTTIQMLFKFSDVLDCKMKDFLWILMEKITVKTLKIKSMIRRKTKLN